MYIKDQNECEFGEVCWIGLHTRAVSYYFSYKINNMQPLKFPLLYIPQIIIIIIIIRKRNRRAFKKRTKINVLFLKVGAFLCK
jgi:hypothetical protein